MDGAIRIYRDESSITILHSMNQKVLNLNALQWHKDGESPDESVYLTLDEIAEQMNKLGCFPPFMLIQEMPLSGYIYQWGNYSDHAWHNHGKTRGYA